MHTPSVAPIDTSVLRQPRSGRPQAPAADGSQDCRTAPPCTHTVSGSGSDISGIVASHAFVQKSVPPIWRAAKHVIAVPSASVPQSGSGAVVSHLKMRDSKAALSTLHAPEERARGASRRSEARRREVFGRWEERAGVLT